MMKPKKLTLGLILVVGMIASGVLISTLFKTIDQQVAATSMHSSKQEHPEYSELKVVTEKTTAESYSIGLHYPQFNNKKLNEKINTYIDTVKKEFKENVEGNEKQRKDHKVVLAVRSETKKYSGYIYSVVLNTSITGEGTSKNQHFSSVFMIDTKSNTYIDQAEILKDTEKTRQTLFSLLHQAFEKSDQYGDDSSKKKLKQWVFNEKNVLSNMYLSGESAVFMFAAGHITPREILIPIPLSRLHQVLTEKWKPLVPENKQDKKESAKKDKEEELGKEQEEKREELVLIGEGVKSSSGQKRVALTFDDGPDPVNTPKVLDLLKQYDAKATFFMQGNQVMRSPDVAKQVKKAGHEIGNHTWSHKLLTKLGNKGIQEEVEKANKAIYQVTGKQPTLFRPPYASTNNNVTRIAGLPSILWSVDTKDWQSRNPTAILNEVKRSTTDGAIILMHDVHTPTVEGLKLVLDYLDSEGYEFVTVSEIRRR